MAEKLADYNDESPIIQDTSIAHRTSGEEIAKASEDVEKTAYEIADDVAKQRSHTQLLSAHSDLTKLHDQAEIEILQNPQHGEDITKAFNQNVEQAKKTTPLNVADKEQFNYLADGMVSSLQKGAAEKKFAVDKQIASSRADQSFDATQRRIYEGIYSNDLKERAAVEDLSNSTIGQAHELVASGVWTADHADARIKAQNKILDTARFKLHALATGNANADVVNAIDSTIPHADPLSIANNPSDVTTQQHAAAHVEQGSIKDYRSTLDAGEIPSFSSTRYMSPRSVQENSEYQNGSALANGKIMSNRPYPELKQEYANSLARGTHLTPMQLGYQNRLRKYMDDVEHHGYYGQQVANTVQGAKNIKDYNTNRAAIEADDYYGTPDQIQGQKNARQNDNLNDFYRKQNAIGIASNIPAPFRTIIDPRQVQAVEHGFDRGGDVAGAVKELARLTPDNRVLLVNAIQTPRLKVAAYQAAMLMGNTPGESGRDKFINDLITSQQAGWDYKNLIQTKEAGGQSDDMLRSQIEANSKVAGVLRYLSKAHPAELNQGAGLTEGAIAYIKYRALRAGDYSYSNLSTYVNDYASNIGKVNDFITSHNYQIDRKVIPVNPAQADALHGYAMDRAKKLLGEDMNPDEVNEYLSRNSPYLLSYADGAIRLVDSSGNLIVNSKGVPAMNTHFDNDLMKLASHAQRQRDTQRMQVNEGTFSKVMAQHGSEPASDNEFEGQAGSYQKPGMAEDVAGAIKPTVSENELPKNTKPPQDMDVAKEGYDFIKNEEKFDPVAKNITGHEKTLTIGYGFARTGAKDGDTMTREEADKLLPQIVKSYADKVRSGVKIPLNANQFHALVSFTYNHGSLPKDVREPLNQGNFKTAMDNMKKYNYQLVDGKRVALKVLVARRKREVALFNKG